MRKDPLQSFLERPEREQIRRQAARMEAIHQNATPEMREVMCRASRGNRKALHLYREWLLESMAESETESGEDALPDRE